MAVWVLLLALGMPGAGAAGPCRDSQPCGGACIPWESPCVVKERPGSEGDGWEIPWELLNGRLVRNLTFCGVYVALFLIAQRASVGPREV